MPGKIRFWRYVSGDDLPHPLSTPQAEKAGRDNLLTTDLVIRADTKTEAYIIATEWMQADAADSFINISIHECRAAHSRHTYCFLARI